MLSFDDKRWATLKAGYRRPVDLRPLLRELEEGEDRKSAWENLWIELYHQGDVGEGSYVAIPHLVRIHRQHDIPDWNPYGIAASVELARGVGKNPDVPYWTRDAYEGALRDLANLGLAELPRARDDETVRTILALLAIVHGARTYGRVLIEFTEDELDELEKAAFGGSADKSG